MTATRLDLPRGLAAPWRAVRLPLIILFVALNLTATVLCLVPRNRLPRVVARPLARYVQCCGLMQRWQIFAPDPTKVSQWLSARIAYPDGSQTTLSLARPPDQFLPDYTAARYRDWNRAILDNFGLTYDAARFAYQMLAPRPQGARQVELIQNIQRLAPPAGQGTPSQPPAMTAHFYSLTLPTTK